MRVTATGFALVVAIVMHVFMKRRAFKNCSQFRGHRRGYVYKCGNKGLGYYKDVR